MRTPVVLLGVGFATAMLVACEAPGPGSSASSQSSPATSAAATVDSPSVTSLPSTEATSSDAGVEGRTIVDGGCPVEIEGSPCPPKPISARLTVVNMASGVSVAATTSSTDGRFRIALAPGRYWLQAVNLSGAAYPRSTPVEVLVERGRFTVVTIEFDSGIQ